MKKKEKLLFVLFMNISFYLIRNSKKVEIIIETSKNPLQKKFFLKYNHVEYLNNKTIIKKKNV